MCGRVHHVLYKRTLVRVQPGTPKFCPEARLTGYPRSWEGEIYIPVLPAQKKMRRCGYLDSTPRRVVCKRSCGCVYHLQKTAPNIPIIRTGRTAGGAICSRYRRNVEKRFALIFAGEVRVRVPYGVFHEEPEGKQQTRGKLR